MRVAWIGLGVMGYPMAGHLVTRGGFGVTVYNRTKAKAEKWAAAFNGPHCATPAEAAREADEALQQLFDDEKQQRLDDIERWSLRLKSIRDERKREIEAVNLRYEDPQPFVFPAALVFALTPEDGAK